MYNNYSLKEIGSEFWDVPISDTKCNHFPLDTLWFISGTAALEYIIESILRTKIINSVAIPSWCCNCIVTPFIKNHIEVKFYPVYMDEKVLVCDYSGIKADCWLLLSYFGYTGQINVGRPLGIIIRDLTHSIFSKNDFDADYYFGSLRKWAGFYTGGFAWSEKWNLEFDIPECDTAYITMKQNAMSQKKSYIIGNSNSKLYLKLFEKCEDFLDRCVPMKACKSDIEKVKYLDLAYIKNQRRKNAKILINSLHDWVIFSDICDDDCPLFVPITLKKEKRDKLRKYLIENDIYCPVHWPIENEHILDSKTKLLYDTELSIICDQRYNEYDMKRIIKCINDSGII